MTECGRILRFVERSGEAGVHRHLAASGGGDGRRPFELLELGAAETLVVGGAHSSGTDVARVHHAAAALYDRSRSIARLCGHTFVMGGGKTLTDPCLRAMHACAPRRADLIPAVKIRFVLKVGNSTQPGAAGPSPTPARGTAAPRGAANTRSGSKLANNLAYAPHKPAAQARFISSRPNGRRQADKRGLVWVHRSRAFGLGRMRDGW